MSIGKISSNIINSPLGNLSARIISTNFTDKLMAFGGIVSYPFWVYGLAGDLEGNGGRPGLGDYIMSSFVSTVPSVITAIMTPIIFYSSPIWFPMWLIDKKIRKSD
jgi:hypothetical protein